MSFILVEKKMSISNRLTNHFALAAVATAAVAATSNAAVIQSSIVNLVIPANLDGQYMNVESGAIGTSGSSTPGWDINPYSSTSLSWYNAGGSGMMRYPGVTTGSAGSLAMGTVVSGAASITGSGASVFGAAAGNWTLNASNYFGFKFLAADGLTHYGYGRMDVGATNLIRTVHSIFYEGVAGAAITVPAPGALALLGLAGLATRRRRA